MQKKRMQNKIMQIKPTLTAKVTLNTNSYCQQKQEKRPAQYYFYFERTFKRWDYFLFQWANFLRSKNIVDFTKTFFIRGCVRMRKKCVNILHRKCPLHGTIQQLPKHYLILT